MVEFEVCIVLLIIIEGGYNFDVFLGEFIIINFDVIYDIENFKMFKLVFGYLVVVFKKCKENNVRFFIVMFCDNI